MKIVERKNPMSKSTCSTLFLCPLTGNLPSALRKHGFINAYVRDELRIDEFENCLLLVFKPENLVGFEKFIEEEKFRTTNLVDDYDYPGKLCVLVYELPKDFEKDIEKIYKGQYSKVSSRFKKLFPEFAGIGLSKRETLQYWIFTKSPKLKEKIEKKYDLEIPDETELWEMFDIEFETLKFEHE